MLEGKISTDDATPLTGNADGFFDRMSARIGSQKNTAPAKAPNIHTKQALLLLQSYEESRQGWFWSTDEEGNITYITDFIAKIVGKEAADLIGSPFVNLFFKAERNSKSQRTLPFILTKQSKFEELALQAATSENERWWSVSGQPQFDKLGNFTGFRGNGSDITAQRRASEDTERLARFDSLTGLANRSNMGDKLEKTLSAFKAQNQPCSVMLLDLDRFKQVNDTLGHPAGDALLKQVAGRLKKAVGERGEAGRLGGDEFQIILPHIEDRGTLGDIANNIISSLSQPYSIEGSRCIIGASVGIAISPFDGETSDELIRSADLALYAAKGGGRGRFRFYSSELHQSADERRQLEEDLRDALVNDQLTLHYQPLVNAKTNIVSCFEALMRWEHPERGMISPAVFIPIAEEANLIGPLGEWAINKACMQATEWPGNPRVAVNVSPIQFANDMLPTIVEDALKASGLKPERLELEITEGVFLGEHAEDGEMFTKLKKVGVRLALDDFGTGYSSMSYLQSAPFDKIKIDQSFVRGATQEGSRNGAIIAAIVALAEALGMETTAEGIETLDELEMIRDLNVTLIQGYVYSKPVRNEELLENFKTGDWKIEPSGPAHHRDERFSVFRKVGAIHENHRYEVVIRNLSASGALMEGLVNVPVDTPFVIDFGDGQLAVSKVRRSMGHKQGIEFETRLVDDGNGGLCTAHRVSPHLIAAATSPIRNMPENWNIPQNMMHAPQASLPVFSSKSDWKD